mgnify:CR=1 FL=1
MTTWIEDLVLRRKAQNSNVYLVETLDFARITQLKEILMKGFSELVGKQYDRLVEHDLQRGTITNLATRQEESVDAMGPYQQLDRWLRSQPTVCVIKYVVLPSHAEVLSNLTVPWSHDEKLYNHKSTVIIFCAALSLFNENVRRLCYQISIPPSSAEEREAILRKLSEDLVKGLEEIYHTKTTVSFDERHISASSGLTLHDTETAAMESFFKHRKLNVEVFTTYKIAILKNYGIEWVQPTRGFESVGGYDYLKQYVQGRVISVLNDPESARRYGLDVPRGLLLFGPPGTGKTYFSKAVAKESGLPMLKITPADFLRGIVGETETRVKQLTGLIETLTPCIVFIDEFDQLSLRRDTQFVGDSGVSRRMQNMLLDWMGDENRKSFIVGATNFIDVDPAFIRPGRIDEIVLVLPPDLEARREILRVHVAMRKAPVEDLDYAAVAKSTFAWTGAELERLVKEAAALAMEEKAGKITGQHFYDAIKSFDVNTDDRVNNVRAMVQKLKSLEQVNQRFLTQALRAFAEREEATDSRLRGLISGMQPGVAL